MTRSLYKIAVKTGFSSAHSLKGYQGPCENIHGHNWRVKVVISSDKLNELGMTIDFKDISSVLDEVTSELDHRNIDTLQEFRDKNPTAENLARYIYHEMMKHLPHGVSLEEVEVSETDRYSVAYSE